MGEVLTECVVDVSKAMSRTPDPWEWKSLPWVRLREIAKPSLGLSANVDSVCREMPILGPSFLL